MGHLKTYLAGAAFLLAAALGATAASATTVIGTLNSVGTGDSIGLHTTAPNGNTIGAQALTGIENFTRTGGTDTSALVGPTGGFLAFCLEPFEDAAINASYTYTVQALANADNSSISGGIGVTKATQISELFGKYAPNFAAITSTQASALQVAIWEIVSELPSNPFDVFHGNTYFTGDTANMLSLAQSYLDYVSTANGQGPLASGLTALTANGSQDMLVQVVSAAPEPGTWMMMIMGFGLIGRVLRTRSRDGAMLQPAYRTAG